jgi:hypothetical protein
VVASNRTEEACTDAMAAMGMGLKQAVTLKSSFCGASLSPASASPARAENVAFAIRAGGYTDELIKTAVSACLVVVVDVGLMLWCWGLGSDGDRGNVVVRMQGCLVKVGRECDRCPRRQVCPTYESGMWECRLCAIGLWGCEFLILVCGGARRKPLPLPGVVSWLWMSPMPPVACGYRRSGWRTTK